MEPFFESLKKFVVEICVEVANRVFDERLKEMNTTSKKVFTQKEVARILNITPEYLSRTNSKYKIVNPGTNGKAHMYTNDDIDKLKKFFNVN